MTRRGSDVALLKIVTGNVGEIGLLGCRASVGAGMRVGAGPRRRRLRAMGVTGGRTVGLRAARGRVRADHGGLGGRCR